MSGSERPGGKTLEEALAGAVSEFNRGRYFECHDTLEELWTGLRGPERGFVQALIQLAVGLYHLQSGNRRGALSQLHKAWRGLDEADPECLGLDLRALRPEIDRLVSAVRAEAAVDLASLPRIQYLRD